MVTNFSVADTSVASYQQGNINNTRYRRPTSAVLQAVAQSGGQVLNGLPPVTNSLPITTGQTPIVGVTESLVGGSVSKQTSARSMTKMDLLIKAHGEVERVTDQVLRARLFGTDMGGFGAKLVADKLPAIYGGFDRDHLRTLAATGTGTSVEWQASAPIATLSTVLATYDETPYNATAMIVTRKGARVMGLAVDGEGRLQFNGSLSSLPIDMPILYTDATAADINMANILAVVGPFNLCAVGESGGTIVKVFDQLEPTNGGAQENIISFFLERYMGFIQPPTGIVPAASWVKIVDAA